MSDFEPAQTQVFDPNAAARLEALKRYDILDTDRDAIFDGIAELAAALFDAPVVIVNFIADDRQWFKAEIGIGRRELPLDVSICRFALPERGIFVVPDLAGDARFANNPQVVAADGARFYAGAVLESDGIPIGTVCVLDRKPRPAGISDAQRRGLEALAVQAMAALERSATAKHDRYRLALTERLRDAMDAPAMMAAATKALGEYLGVAQVGFAEVEDDQAHIRILRDWNDGRIASVVGRWHIDDFGPAFIRDIKAGETIVIPDVVLDTRTNTPEALANFAAIGTRALLNVGLIRDGEMRALLFTHHHEPRAWTTDDVAIVEETVERLWAAVERAWVEEALQVSESGLRLAQEMGGIGTWRWNHAIGRGRMTASAKALHGLAEDGKAVTNEELYAVIHEDDLVVMPSLYSDERITVHYRVVLPNGDMRWIRATGQRVGSSGSYVTAGIVEDVTERVAGETLLQDRAARLSLISRTAAKLVLKGAQAHELLREIFSDIAERIGVEMYFNYQLGDEPETLMMASSGGLDDAVRAHFARLRFGEQLCGTVAETRMPLIIEDLQKTENPKAAEFKSAGATCYAGYPLLADGELMGTIAFASRERVHFAPGDLELIDTVCHLVAAALAREQLETGLQRANTQLETKVATRTADLVSANRALKAEIKRREATQAALIQGQKLEALGQLTSGIAHDFNNILASIAGGMSLIERRTDDDEIKVLTGHCQDAAFKGAKLVKQMLAFASQEVLAPSAVSLATLAEEVRPLITQAIPGNVVVIDLPADLPKVQIDAVMLETALLNLAVNARDAMPGGGSLAITATTSQPGDPGHPVELAAVPAVAIAVRDDGTGMPPEVVQRVTEPFFTTKAPGTGTGLGLAMVYGFVTQSGGALRIKSRPKQGTTVTLYLPFASDADIAPSPATATQAEAARPGIGAIMLVDDDPTVRAIAAEQLRDLGYTVTAADGLAGAMALIDAGAVFDCVVSDVVMLGGDGIALAEAIRATQPALPILFMTGRADNARVAGETVVPKPFKIGELAGAVATAIARPAQEAATLEKIGARCRSRCVADMLDHWRTSKTVSKVPQFGDFDPDICAEPHRLAVIKADPAQLPMRFEVVSAGKELEALLGRPLHGTELDVRGLDGFGSIEESYRRAVKSGLPVFDTMRMDFGDGTPERFERIVLPYSSSGQITDRLVSVVVFATENIENAKEDRL